MGLYNLDRLFNPRAVAVIGASEQQRTIGNALMVNLIAGGIQDQLIPVNPKYSNIYGLTCHSSVSASKRPVDLAVIATPIHTVESIIKECVDSGVGAAVIISAGGKETGESGRAIEERIKAEAYKGGLRLIGPNCFGIICPNHQLNATFGTDMPLHGNLAFVSQSGAMCSSILDLAFKEHIGFSHFISLGSMIDVDFGDMIDYLGNQPSAKSILLYVENLTNYRKFMSAARSVSRVKPIVVLKSGRSPAGARAAASHTGAMAGEDAVYDAAFKRAGVVRVNTIQELFDCAELMAKQPRPAGSRLAVISNAGGPGVMAADALAHYGVEPEPLNAETIDKLNRILPKFWSRNNPIDILGDSTSQQFAQTVETCIASNLFDGILVITAPQALSDPAVTARMLIETMKGKRFPIFASWMGGKRIQESIEILNQAAIPTYETPERAIRAFLYMVEYSKNLEMSRQIPPKLMHDLHFDREKVQSIIETGMKQGAEFLSESDSKCILDAYGIPVNMTFKAASVAEAIRMAGKIGFPLVLKLLSPDITHKTEANGVQVDIRSDEEIIRAYRTIMDGAAAYKPDARIDGVTLQNYIHQPEIELLIGAKRDENFGPVILFGMGGIYTEMIKDRAIGFPPLNRLLAHRLMEETHVFSLLKGYRNRPGANIERLEELLIRLSQLLVDFPEIAELDMNPVMIKNGLPQAVDARIALKPSPLTSSLHLVISPYPEQYEFNVISESGIRVFIRPVKPEDASMFVKFFEGLSHTSIYYRFFRDIKSLTPDMLARFTQVDYDREVALVALDESQSEDNMLGVARITGDPDGKTGEFAVLIADRWQGQGIGAKLLGICLEIAQLRGMEIVRGNVLKNNRHMLALGKKLCFHIGSNVDEPTTVELSINLQRVDLVTCSANAEPDE